ncbi:hypothetical protein C8J56DRAFT_883405 [Mycena floridula]|nr:hypothetical protein C8J56DRAFT_883405 [Mycena floridula]
MAEKHISDTILNPLKCQHEALLEKSNGTYYAGNAVNSAALSRSGEHREMYGDRNPCLKFPKIMKVVETTLASKLAEYVHERRDHRVWKWDLKCVGALLALTVFVRSEMEQPK